MKKKYIELEGLNEKSKDVIKSKFINIVVNLKDVDFKKILDVFVFIPDLLKLSYDSRQNRLEKEAHKRKHHPIIPVRGQIYNAYLGENIGSELCGNHLVVIVQNKKGNIFGERVNVLPIEGDGTKINPNYQIKLSNSDLEYGKLDKNPSRIIVTDINTIDKARLGIRIGQIKSEKMGEINNLLINQLELVDKVNKK